MREEILMVLKMLQEGKITAADAEKLISAIQKQPEPSERPQGFQIPSFEAGLGAARRSAKAAAKRAKELLSQLDAERYVSQAMRQLEEALKRVDSLLRDMEAGRRTREFVTREQEETAEAQREQFVNVEAEHGVRAETVTFPEGEVDDLKVSTPIGNISARRVDGEPVAVKVIFRAVGTDEASVNEKLQEMVLDVRRVNGDVDVSVRSRGEQFPENCSADVEVQVPSGVDLTLKAVHGSVDVEGMDGDLTAESVNGAVNVRNISGDAVVKSVNGGVKASDVSGDLELTSVNGGARASNITGDLKTSSVNGGLEIVGVQGDVTANTVNGSAYAESISGDARLETVNGSLEIRNCSGDLTVKSLNGTIEASGVSSSDVRIQGGSGSVSVELADGFSGDLVIETTGGSITLTVPPDASCRISAASASGGVSSDLALAEEQRTEHELSGVLGGGDGEVVLKSGSGSIALKSRGGVLWT
jgi:DUF4097 and DUF4098 domain-containing protein YvlB